MRAWRSRIDPWFHGVAREKPQAAQRQPKAHGIQPSRSWDFPLVPIARRTTLITYADRGVQSWANTK